MNIPLFLFCGGPAIDSQGRPKPLMKIREDRTLLVHFLLYLQHRRASLPRSVTLLCDDGQENVIQSEVSKLRYPVEIQIEACGQGANTFQKFCHALNTSTQRSSVVQFGYPDIFSFENFSEPQIKALESNATVYISSAALTSRFPRLVIDVYNGCVSGISDYSSPVPANPLHIFGGDLWGSANQLLELVAEFSSKTKVQKPSLEYDFFFWLVNQKKIHCVMQYGERLWVDSFRDVKQLLIKTEDIA